MKESHEKILADIRGKLIVSCQALPHEPLHSSFIMGRMAFAACKGGAAGIRANTVADIKEIKKNVSLPIIGIIKAEYGSNPVYITPTLAEVDQLVGCGCEIIATDATGRTRPDGKTMAAFFSEVRDKYPDQLFMADISTYEEGLAAWQAGFDIIGTTLCGYTEYTKDIPLPAIDLVKRLAAAITVPIIAEGGIHYPRQLREVLLAGAHSAVVGGAITRPMEITERFVRILDCSKEDADGFF